MKVNTLIIFFSVWAILSSCGKKAENTTAVDTLPKVVINDTLAKHISLDTAHTMPLVNELHLTGEVAFDDSKVSKVFAMQSGQTTSVNVALGDYVHVGETLAVLRSADMASNQADLVSAQADVLSSKKLLDNTQELLKNGLASQMDVTTAQNTFNKATATLDKIREIVALHGGGGGGSTYTLKAPISGYILEKKVNNGQLVRPDAADNLFTIGNLTDVWVMADVYETDLSKVKEGMNAYVTTLAYPDKVLHGKVSKLNRVLDPLSKVAKARIQLDNSEGKLAPEMFANITLTSPAGGQAIAIPSKSIIMEYSKNYVVIYKDRQHVEIREVQIIHPTADKTFVTGVNEGEQVITASNLLIFNALKS